MTIPWRAAKVGAAPDIAALDLTRSCKIHFPEVTFVVGPGRRKHDGNSILAFKGGEPLVGQLRTEVVTYIAAFEPAWKDQAL